MWLQVVFNQKGAAWVTAEDRDTGELVNVRVYSLHEDRPAKEACRNAMWLRYSPPCSPNHNSILSRMSQSLPCSRGHSPDCRNSTSLRPPTDGSARGGRLVHTRDSWAGSGVARRVCSIHLEFCGRYRIWRDAGFRSCCSVWYSSDPDILATPMAGHPL